MRLRPAGALDTWSHAEIVAHENRALYLARYGCLGDCGAWLQRRSPDGSLEWEKVWDAETSVRHIAVATDGSVVVSYDGPTSSDNQEKTARLAKFDDMGELAWERTLEIDDNPAAFTVLDSGLVALYSDLNVVAKDDKDVEAWAWPSSEYLVRMVPSIDGGLIASGPHRAPAATLSKRDDTGAVVWRSTVESPTPFRGADILGIAASGQGGAVAFGTVYVWPKSEGPAPVPTCRFENQMHPKLVTGAVNMHSVSGAERSTVFNRPDLRTCVEFDPTRKLDLQLTIGSVHESSVTFELDAPGGVDGTWDLANPGPGVSLKLDLNYTPGGPGSYGYGTTNQTAEGTVTVLSNPDTASFIVTFQGNIAGSDGWEFDQRFDVTMPQ
ncbi:MAG: hypothetical protein V3V08_14370 [Nannocystaceae bacterium]